MGSYMNFKNFGDTTQPDGSCGKQNSNYPLARQSSVFSLTFEEFQNTLRGATSKDFGSMNMEDLLKNIWTVDEGQAIGSSTGGGEVNIPGESLQRQGSLTLPRTLSQKTVDEVWRDVLKETIGAKGEISGGCPNLTKEPTLSEITLEEFLFKAGVVREDIQPSAMPNDIGIYNGLLPGNGNNCSAAIGFQQSPQSHGVVGNQFVEPKNMVHNSPNLGINMSGFRSSPQLPQQLQPQLQPLFPKQTTLTFSAPGNNTQLSSSGTRCMLFGTPNTLNNTSAQGGEIFNGGSNNGLAVTVGSPGDHLKSGTDTQSPSPPPYDFGQGAVQGRRGAGSLEKVVERRRKRMIKNRESAARSRARKQAYTLELEAEVAKLKELNQELRKKQEELVLMQKNQVSETVNKPCGGKRMCLRRTRTGPW